MTTPRYEWQPTTAEIAAANGIRLEDVVRFDHNTSPFTTDWAPGLVTLMARNLNEYPGASYASLRTAAADYLGTNPDGIVPGAGADEIILLIARAFLGPRLRACAPVPTYPLYEIVTLQVGSEFLGIEYEPDFGFPLRALGEAAETSDVTWLCVPSNPTGHRTNDHSVAAILNDAKGIVVIDAAYAEYSGDRWADWIDRYDNLIVCHTMSKGFGLAGLRVGFAMTTPDLADRLDAVRPPGSISTISGALAEQALATPQRMERHVGRILTERSRLASELAEIGVEVVPDSAANFVLCEIGDDASSLANSLLAEGLVVRQFPKDHPLDRFLRFTVRARHENEMLIDALRRRLT